MVNQAYEQDENVIEYAPVAGGSRQARQAHAVEQYRQRSEGLERAVRSPSRPEVEHGDERGRFGGRRDSLALQRHNAQMMGIYRAKEQADYTRRSALALEYYALKESITTVAAEERELLQTDPNSMSAVVGEQLFLDSVERIRQMNTDVVEDFRRKALGR